MDEHLHYTFLLIFCLFCSEILVLAQLYSHTKLFSTSLVSCVKLKLHIKNNFRSLDHTIWCTHMGGGNFHQKSNSSKRVNWTKDVKNKCSNIVSCPYSFFHKKTSNFCLKIYYLRTVFRTVLRNILVFDN